MSPLQLAVAYSALVNGGKIWEPRLGWAVVDHNGKTVRTIEPKLRRTVPVSRTYLNYIADSLDFGRGWAVSGAFAYIGSPYQSRLGGKTGTAEVEGKKDTSWLASWGPTTHDRKGNVGAKFVVVGMIEQAGTGATAAGPMLKRIWDAIMGAHGKPIVAGKKPITTLPKVTQTR
jgi:penicillin-binding protein 2